MQTLVSLSPSVADHFAAITGKGPPGWFTTHDPVDRKLGSGGGTLHLLREAWKAREPKRNFEDWLQTERGILLHAGGQSRRLPGYAAEGKALIPVPVFRWSTGQRINQTLLDLQVPFLEKVLAAADTDSRWLVASGDVLVQCGQLPSSLPRADVVCLGIWGEPDQASRHGVFFTPREEPEHLSFMLQKPGMEAIRRHAREHYFLLDVGIWILSARAMRALQGACARAGGLSGTIGEVDLYGDFGPAMGSRPAKADPEINSLKVAVVPLEEGEFYHFGSGPDLLESALRLQNRVSDQRRLWTRDIKPHPSLFVQNSLVGRGVLSEERSRIWIENSHLPESWVLSREHIITGIPRNNWSLELEPGDCLESLPLKDGGRVVRPYGFRDSFRGAVGSPETCFCGEPLHEWLRGRGLGLDELQIDPEVDIQEAALFPVFTGEPDAGLIQWLLRGGKAFAGTYTGMRRVSAATVAAEADLPAVARQRAGFLAETLPVMARHAERSVFYQVDLEHLAELYSEMDLPLPERRPDVGEDLFRHIRDAMFRARVLRRRGGDDGGEASRAFGALREALIESARKDPVRPVRDILDDQIVWARSPVRLDLAGGWTDTPPYCFLNGGKVLNLAVELNGQPPIQAFIRPRPEGGIKLRSIDLGVSEEVHSYGALRACAGIGSGFAIPKAALALCGFLPEFHAGKCPETLSGLLDRFGSGIEISLLCAVPKGSGLGTSSILAATLLAALSDLCQLGWDPYAIGQRVLVLEQMLTSGGGWQDQYGGICRGLKYLETRPGLEQAPKIHWMDDHLFSDPAYRPHILLYYTGITRVAKRVLGEIVEGMFLNSGQRLDVLAEISENAEKLKESMQEGHYDGLCAGVRRSWELNQALDPGTNPPEIAKLLEPLADWIGGCKLLGAGGGGYLLILARDSLAAHRIKEHLRAHAPNAQARFVDLAVSRQGLQVTRS
ncbi:MAG: bifunctional fucokinase/fucose-1-phosphate guanylyltransferase [Oceanipulchritudo sp.]